MPSATVDSDSPSSSPSISFSSTATQEPVDVISALPKDSSEEAAIVSIYSMYGDDSHNRHSWNPPSSYTFSRSSLLKQHESLNGNGHPRENSYESGELAYLQNRHSAIIDLTAEARNSQRNSEYNKRSSAGSHKTGNFTSLSSTPATSSYSPSTTRYSSTTRSSFKDLSPISSPSTLIRPVPVALPTTVDHSPRLSPTPQYLNVPLSRPSSHHSQRSERSRQTMEQAAEDVPASSSPTPSPKATSSLPLKHPVYTGSPESNTSLVPSEGEDMDAFHVRNTYAQLDVSGVKGDGYEDGVERTRARVGGSRASQINAAAAIGDGNEKKGDLDERELIALASVDRYGFFSTLSHDRLVLLPSAPLTKRLTPNSSPGPRDASTSGTTLSSLPPSQPLLKETSRIGKWARMLRPRKREVGGNVDSWVVKPSKESKLRERTYKGVPDRWRPAAWELFLSRNASADVCSGGHGHGATESFSMQQLEQDYKDCLDKPSTYDIQIDLDVPRTISGHVLFRTRYGAGQRSLFHVLHCFSLRCSACGYVQGMGPIAATLLCYFPPSHVYASLVRLHSSPDYALHTIFAPGFPGLLEAIFVQERIIRELLPAVYKAFGDMGVSTTSYATKWYITLFANSVTFQTQLRLWDAFLLEGKDVFVVLAVGVVWVFRDQITSASANFETVLSLLSSFFVPEDENILLSWVGKTMADKKVRANMMRWRADWQEIVMEGKEATVLL
ncbi:hypothetical protein E1B28_007440 [Marasmius oreades]|uniref:Rab-GAP TBC domain-containing protein n=1 Tax=Marasmius oreades TaxID=181124 RepID=A0A9P7S1Y2_9AGAR|nr:uncharacterized protein E1B28_007440 [Marasmius oreades]KAG7093795.1 hypothetical protein E1B28_007440 [Marasmius oreades]